MDNLKVTMFKKLFSFIILILSLNSLASTTASIGCIEFLKIQTQSSYKVVAIACSGGATVKCIDKVKTEIGHDYMKAAKICGQATIECMEKVRPYAYYSYLDSAKACRSGASVECIDEIYEFTDFNKAFAANQCGKATVRCINRVKQDVAQFNKAKAARACNGLK